MRSQPIGTGHVRLTLYGHSNGHAVERVVGRARWPVVFTGRQPYGPTAARVTKGQSLRAGRASMVALTRVAVDLYGSTGRWVARAQWRPPDPRARLVKYRAWDTVVQVL